MIKKIVHVTLVGIALTGFGTLTATAASVSPTTGTKAAFDLLCQNASSLAVNGHVNKQALQTTLKADVGTLASQLNVSQFVAALYLAAAAQQLYADKTAIDSCPH